MTDQRPLWFRENADEILFRQGTEFNADREAPLELWNEIGRFGHMEGPGGDKEDVICYDRAMFCVDGAAFYDGE